jgi:hypothetical protein
VAGRSLGSVAGWVLGTVEVDKVWDICHTSGMAGKELGDAVLRSTI